MRPLKPYKLELNDPVRLAYPLFGMPKYDGVRFIVSEVNGVKVALSNSLKPLPNKHLQELIQAFPLGSDGEVLLSFDPSENLCSEVVSAVMAYDTVSDLKFVIFDNYLLDGGYQDRLSEVILQVNDPPLALGVVATPKFTVIHYPSDLLEYADNLITEGYEGAIFRSPIGKYKHGRSTLKESYMLKFKHIQDDEAVVIGFEPWEQNTAVSEYNELGLLQKSNKLEYKVSKDMLGALVVKHADYGEFRIGTGFTHDQRIQYWRGRENLTGKTVTFKFMPHGVKDKPRHPVFKMFRPIEDL